MTERLSFRDRLRQVAPKRLWDASEDLWKFREAAAVLAWFNYEQLQANGQVDPSSDAKRELLADCDPLYSPDGTSTLWSLRTPIRQAALRRLVKTGSLEAALGSNPQRPDSTVQKLLERYLRSESAHPIVSNLHQESRAMLQVATWLEGVPELTTQMPPTDVIKRELAREQLLDPFRSLVGAQFAGRQKELEQLADYVGVQQSSSVTESIARGIEWVFSIRERPPLFIYGPGGSGKSSLLAKFILNHTEVPEEARFPFAYLDFDRRGLVAEEPITLLPEIARQIAIQFPSVEASYRELSENWTKRVEDQLGPSSLPATDEVQEQPDIQTDEVRGRPDRPSRTTILRINNREAFLDEFSGFINQLKAADQPLLLVLDTFEEVQFRSGAYVEEVLEFLNNLQSRIPRLRTVLSGRAKLRSSNYKARFLELGPFDEDAAVALLMGQGVSDRQLAKNIFQQVGGSPLMLRLAADVAKLENPQTSGLAGLSSGWLSIFREKSKEVMLYKRILSHVVDSRISQLAYPGLVLRIITPDVLKDVLAPSCGVSITSREDAALIVRTMHEQLGTILVPTNEDEETLIHRPDMRSILLQDVNEKAQKNSEIAAKLRAIHTRAIGYYAQYKDPQYRSEEIYHRLALGIDRDVLAARWLSGMAPYLGSSIRELPAQSQVYLASRLGLELPPDLWMQAADADWILYASRLVRQLLELHKPPDALDVLNQRRQLWTNHQLRPVVEQTGRAMFTVYATEYENVRAIQKAGNARTRRMESIMDAVTRLAVLLSMSDEYPRALFAEKTPGMRVVAIRIAQTYPSNQQFDMVIEGIQNALSPFEQFQALRLAQSIVEGLTPGQQKKLEDALNIQYGTPIHETDPSRLRIKNDLLTKLSMSLVRNQEGLGEHRMPSRTSIEVGSDREGGSPVSDTKPRASIKLPSDFVFGELRPDHTKPAPPAPPPPLGPLSAFVGDWVGNGFNTIFRPDSAATPTVLPNPVPAPPPPRDNILELNLTSESLSFSPRLGSVPNRGTGAQPDAFLNGVPYLQTISDITIHGESVGIHVEPGIWIHVPATTIPQLGETVTRMASIPHGATIEAQGLVDPAKPGPPTIAAVDITPSVTGSNPVKKVTFASQTASNPNTPRIPQDLGPFITRGTITQAMLDDPNSLLRAHISKQNIISTTTIFASTAPPPPVGLFGGGTDNIAFLLGQANASAPNAQAAQMTAVFWIETVEEVIKAGPYRVGDPPFLIKATRSVSGQRAPRFSVTPPFDLDKEREITVTFTQIQYSQTVLLNFAGLTWPHVSVNTLVPADDIIVPPSVWK